MRELLLGGLVFSGRAGAVQLDLHGMRSGNVFLASNGEFVSPKRGLKFLAGGDACSPQESIPARKAWLNRLAAAKVEGQLIFRRPLPTKEAGLNCG